MVPPGSGASKELEHKVTDTERQVAELRRDIAEMDARLASRLERVEQHLDGMDRRNDGMERRLKTVEDGVGELEGDSLERRVKENPRRYLGPVVTGAVLVSPDDFDISTLDNNDEQFLREGDVIVRGASVPSGQEVVAVVETAWMAHQDDLDKAMRRVPILARVSRLPALPLVISLDTRHPLFQ